MCSGLKSIKIDSDADRAQAVSLLDEQIGDLMHITHSKQVLKSFESDSDVIMTIARSENKGLIEEKDNRVYLKCIEAEVQM